MDNEKIKNKKFIKILKKLLIFLSNKLTIIM